MKVEMTVLGARQTRDRLEGLAERAQTPRDALAQAGKVVANWWERNWIGQGALFGKKWPALALETLERKSREGLPNRPLVATGALMRAVQSPTIKPAKVSARVSAGP